MECPRPHPTLEGGEACPQGPGTPAIGASAFNARFVPYRTKELSRFFTIFTCISTRNVCLCTDIDWRQVRGIRTFDPH